MNGRVGAVVLYYERGEDVIGAVESLRSQTTSLDRVLLVDNASSVRPARGLAGMPRGVDVLTMEANLGYAAAMNRGASILGPAVDAILFATHEVRLECDCVEEMFRRLEADPDVAVVGPLLGRRSQPDRVYSAGGVYRGIARRPDHLAIPSHLIDWPRDALVFPQWLDGSLLLVRRTAFEAVGGFDPAYFLYMEDADFCERVRAQGWAVQVSTAARAWEDSAGTDPATYLESRLRLHARSHGPVTVIAAIAMELLRGVRRVMSRSVDRRRSGAERFRQIRHFAVSPRRR